MNLFAVSDATVLEVAKMLFTLLGTIFTGIMTVYMAKLHSQAKTAVVQAEETKTTLAIQTQVVADKLDDIRAATDTTNALVSEGNDKK